MAQVPEPVASTWLRLLKKHSSGRYSQEEEGLHVQQGGPGDTDNDCDINKVGPWEA